MRIRSDLQGVVYVPVGGDVVCLAAGDEVPDGAVVGEHLTSEQKEPVEAPKQSEQKEPTEAPEQETKGAGNSRGRRSATRS